MYYDAEYHYEKQNPVTKEVVTPTEQQIQYVIAHIARQKAKGAKSTTITRMVGTSRNTAAFRNYNNIQQRLRLILDLPELRAVCDMQGPVVEVL